VNVLILPDKTKVFESVATAEQKATALQIVKENIIFK
jgi:hypothetical protein